MQSLLHELRRKAVVEKIDRVMMVAAVVHPFSAIPQVYTIYANQDAGGVSLLTWIFFTILGTIGLVYDIVHKLKPLIINQVIWLILDALIIAGILMYG